MPREQREDVVAEAIAAGFIAYLSMNRRGRLKLIGTVGFARNAVRHVAAGRRAGSSQAGRDVMSDLGRRRHGRGVQSLDAQSVDSTDGCGWLHEAVADRQTPVVLYSIFGLAHASGYECRPQHRLLASGLQAMTNWYRGNLHMHSLWSDGTDFPEMIAQWYKDQGYHFVAFTEHDCFQEGDKWFAADPSTPESRRVIENDLIQAYVNRFGEDWVQRRRRGGVNEVRLRPLAEYLGLIEQGGRFLILNGEEVTLRHSCDDPDEPPYQMGQPIPLHVNVLNTAQPVDPIVTRESAVEAINRALDSVERINTYERRSVIASLNHPNWQWNATAEDILATPRLRFFEMFTALDSCHSYGLPPRVSMPRMWDIVLSIRLSQTNDPLLYGLAVDDSHDYGRMDRTPPVINEVGTHAGRAWVMVLADELSHAKLVQAMLRGDFYCSTGVALEQIHFDGKTINLKIDAVPGTTYTTRFIGTRQGFDPTSHPTLDKAGNPIDRTTHQYSDQIGTVLAEGPGVEARYNLSGDELYVRAEVISDQPHLNPSILPSDVQRAWTQPVRPG